MMSEGGGSEPVFDPESDENPVEEARPPSGTRFRPPWRTSAAATDRARHPVIDWLEAKAKLWGKVRLDRLAARQGQVSRSMRSIPAHLHRAARQAELLLELVDDFKSGRYRAITWRRMALLVGALLYTVSPADVIPDVLPVLGAFDDAALMALAARVLRQDLVRYCEFKGYELQHYFAD